MTNFIYNITGDNANMLKNFTPYCRKKISMQAWLVLLITTIWFIFGYLLASDMLGCSTLVSWTVAIVCAFVVFTLERAILLCGGNKTMFWFRVTLGVVVALLSSFLIDSIIFKKDTDRYMTEKYHETATAAKVKAMHDFDAQVAQLQQETQLAYSNWNQRTNEHNGEVLGTSGTHLPGYAKAATAKKAIMDVAKATYDKQQLNLEQLKQQQTKAGNDAYANEVSLMGTNTLLHRIEMMHEMVATSPTATFIYVLFFLFALILELMVVFVKSFASKSAYEEEQELLHKMMHSKRTRMQHRDALHNQLGATGSNAFNQMQMGGGNALFN